MVEQEAVNFEVAGSNPVSGAKLRTDPSGSVFSLSSQFANRTSALRSLNSLLPAYGAQII